MACDQRFQVLAVVLIYLLVVPAFNYWIFYDLDLNSIPQNWQNVVTEVLLCLVIPYYLYTATWLSVICFPVSEEVVKEKLQFITMPMGLSGLVSLFQSKWIIFGVILVAQCLLSLAIVHISEEYHQFSDSDSVDTESNESTPIITQQITVTRVVTLYVPENN